MYLSPRRVYDLGFSGFECFVFRENSYRLVCAGSKPLCFTSRSTNSYRLTIDMRPERQSDQLLVFLLLARKFVDAVIFLDVCPPTVSSQ